MLSRSLSEFSLIFTILTGKISSVNIIIADLAVAGYFFCQYNTSVSNICDRECSYGNIGYYKIFSGNFRPLVSDSGKGGILYRIIVF